MRLGGVRGALLGSCALGIVVGLTVGAEAGGFALREQSAAGQGASFAGVAAGGSLASMYWNPAIMTQYYGKAIQADASGIFPKASHSYTASTLATLLGGINSGYRNGVDDSGDDALVPSTYASWQINDKFWVGMSLNAPFGLSVSFPQAWAGAAYAQNSEVKSYNFAPSVAYKINDMFSVSVGLQVQYMKVSYDQLAAPVPVNIANLEGSGWAFGFTAGATITPMPGTVIGIGYRSALDQDIDGTLSATTPGSTPGSISTELKLPDMVTIGLRQRVGDRLTLLAGFEWANWSRIGTSTVTTASGATATISGGAVVLPFQYDDGYYYSFGAEYQFSEALTLRAGVGFEKSPVTDNVRTPRLPDNDRTWYSVGASYKAPWMRGLTFDAGYSYIDVKDTGICLGLASGCPANPWSGATTYIGSVDSEVHIVSLGLRYQWDQPEPAKRMLITK